MPGEMGLSQSMDVLFLLKDVDLALDCSGVERMVGSYST